MVCNWPKLGAGLLCCCPNAPPKAPTLVFPKPAALATPNAGVVAPPKAGVLAPVAEAPNAPVPPAAPPKGPPIEPCCAWEVAGALPAAPKAGALPPAPKAGAEPKPKVRPPPEPNAGAELDPKAGTLAAPKATWLAAAGANAFAEDSAVAAVDAAPNVKLPAAEVFDNAALLEAGKLKAPAAGAEAAASRVVKGLALAAETADGDMDMLLSRLRPLPCNVAHHKMSSLH